MGLKLLPTEDTRCGSIAGHEAHKVRGELPCESCKEGERAYHRLWAKNNPEKIRLKTANRKLAAPDYQKEYAAKNSVRIAQRHALYRIKNLDTVQMTHDRWKSENPDYMKKYHLAHPEKIREAHRRRRARKLNNGYEPYTEEQVLGLYGTDCHICKEPVDLNAPRSLRVKGWERGLHIDHVIPISKGGPDTLENVRPSHGWCNIKKRNQTNFVPKLPIPKEKK